MSAHSIMFPATLLLVLSFAFLVVPVTAGAEPAEKVPRVEVLRAPLTAAFGGLRPQGHGHGGSRR